jgi:diguanylate cyclase (GGDEF)-like protein
VRQRSARQRAQTAHARLDAAHQRDESAQSRDRAALARDQVASARDLAMAARELAYEQEMGATGERKRAAQQRSQAAEQRGLAAEDRRAAAQDREQAARERLRALADREALAKELALLAIDPLTGARTRAAGLIELDHELERCRRTSGLLVVAYIDVVGLKSLNDSDGHGAGDELLKRAVAHIKEHLRPYDLIIRLGGDEFLCAMSNMTLPGARQRLHAIADLAIAPGCGAIRTGFAQLLTPTETATALIARADSDLIDTRRTDTTGSRPDRNSTAERTNVSDTRGQ